MKKIKIEIPDNLSPEQEIFAIAKKLAKKTIANKSTQKLIGSGVEIKELETQITISRVSTESPVNLCVCSVCKANYEKKNAIILYTNYGGATRKLFYCSDECASVVISLSGSGAISKSKSKLKRRIPV